MGSLKGAAEIAIGKAKELVAEILGNGKLREESKLDQRKGEEEKEQSGRLKPLGNLDRLT